MMVTGVVSRGCGPTPRATDRLRRGEATHLGPTRFGQKQTSLRIEEVRTNEYRT